MEDELEMKETRTRVLEPEINILSKLTESPTSTLLSTTTTASRTTPEVMPSPNTLDDADIMGTEPNIIIYKSYFFALVITSPNNLVQQKCPSIPFASLT